MQSMLRTELSELHYIAPISNVPSILARGLLSHRRVASIVHESVANEDVQKRRANRQLQTGYYVHDYVNMYLWARNTMLFVLLRGQGLQNSLCVLRIRTDVLDLPGALVSDRNIACGIAKVQDAATGLAGIDRAVLRARYWNSDDEKQRMCAEALVLHRVDASFIEGAYVAGETAQRQLQAVAPSLPATVHGYLFFQ
jgi:ssDNA thymidine ADP-ribosyltransferase DarT-like protein